VGGSGPEHAVAEGGTDGLLVHQPGPRADVVVPPRRIRTYLPCDVADHRRRGLGRVGRKRSQEPHRAQLHRVAESGDLAASPIHPLEVARTEQEEAGQLLVGGSTAEAAPSADLRLRERLAATGHPLPPTGGSLACQTGSCTGEATTLRPEHAQ
jgi:hypothetical protein